MNLQDILAIQDIGERIQKIKDARKNSLPNRDALLADWDESKHDVMDKEKRPDEIKISSPEERDPISGKVIKAEVTYIEPVNRIPFPLEQDITNIHTAFTVGTPPDITCDTEDEKELQLFKMIKIIDRKQKLKYVNRRVVRSWLSETEVAEYWYTTEDVNFWKLLLNKIKKVAGAKEIPDRKLRCAVWSPFNGDKLYPVFDDAGDYIALGREYQVKVSTNVLETYFMLITDSDVFTWKQSSNNGIGWEVVASQTFKHNFKKNPTIYAWRKESICAKIRNIRNRLETLMSNYADCIDYNFAPKLVAKGKVLNNQPKAARGGLVEVEFGGDVSYLSWQQTPEAAKLEMDTLIEQAYSLTNTPRISFENLKGSGTALSGVAFKFAFMGAHMAVENHAEVIGEYFQRRYNFIASAIGSINTDYEKTAETIDIDVQIVPYMIDNLTERINNAVNAQGVASLKQRIILAGLVDEDMIKEEQEAIESEESRKAEEVNFPVGGQ